MIGILLLILLMLIIMTAVFVLLAALLPGIGVFIAICLDFMIFVGFMKFVFSKKNDEE